MKFYFFLLVVILISSSCGLNPNKRKEYRTLNDKCAIYPSSIDSLKLKDLYDSARWYVYTWHCDETYWPKNDSSKRVTFGKLELNFDTIIVKHDTLELNFNFMDKSEPIMSGMMKNNKEMVTGVGFNMKTKTKIYMMSPSGFSVTQKGNNTRYENPLQPSVLIYLRNNWAALNTCFKELAEQKGIMN